LCGPFVKNAVAEEEARGSSTLNVMPRAKTSRAARGFVADQPVGAAASGRFFLILAAMVAMESKSKIFGA